MRKRTMAGGLVASILLTAATALAAPAAGGLDLPVEKVVLDNGLTLLLLENHESPTLGLVTAFRVGSSSEWDGITGTTHILEHMLFKGTDKIGTNNWTEEKKLLDRAEELAQEIHRLEFAPPGEADTTRLAALRKEFKETNDKAREYVVPNQLWELYQNAGGQDMNADTGPDLTRYYLSLPSNRLELWLYLESSRLRAPVLREFYTEKNNVMEERRLGIENEPSGVLYEEVAAAAFVAHRYGTLPIGWPSDINDVTRTQVEKYFRQYYAPNRMVIAIVGDMDKKKTAAMVKEYFGSIPRQPDPPPVVTVEPEQKGERRIEREFEAEPRVTIAYHRPPSNNPDEPVYQIIDQLLTGGRSGRFQKKIIEGSRIAASISVDIHGIGDKYPTLFAIDGTPRAPHTTAEVEAAIYAELDRLASEPVEARELEKARNQLEAEFVRRMSSNFGLAREIASTEAMFYDWRLLLRQRDAVKTVTPADIQRVAAATFQRRNRTVGTLVPVSAGPAKAVSAAEAATAKSIVDRAVQAMGGRDALARVKDMTTDASLEISTPGGPLPATSHSEVSFPDRVYSEMSVMGQTQSRGFDGSGWWMKMGGTTQDFPPEMVKQARSDFLRETFFFPAQADKESFTLEAQPDAEDGSKVVRVSTADGSSFTINFDPDKGLPRSLAYKTMNPMTQQPAQGEDRLSDYRTVDGVLLPYQVEMYLDGKLFVTQKSQTVAFNKGLDPGKFTRP